MPAPNSAATGTKPAANATPSAAKPTGRARVSNGSQLFLDESAIDGRSVMARRYRDVLAALVSDLGGDPSEAQAQIARRAATLIVWAESAESDMAAGNAIDIASFTTATNALRRLLADLGLERRVIDVGTMSLRDRLVRDRAVSEAGVTA
jgi:hypothetical protein